MTDVGQAANCDNVGGTWIGDYGFPPIKVDAAWPENPGSAPGTDPTYDASNARTFNWGAGLEGFSGGWTAIWHDLKNGAKAAVCGLARPLVESAQAGTGAVGIGVGGSAGVGFLFGVSFQGGVQAVADPKGNVGLAFSGGGNPGFGVFGVGAMGGVQFMSSDAGSIYSLRGPAWNFGVSAGSGPAVGVDVSKSWNNGPISITGTVGPGKGSKATGFALTATAV